MKTTFTIRYNRKIPTKGESINYKTFETLFNALTFLSSLGPDRDAILSRTYTITETLNPTVTTIAFNCGYYDFQSGREMLKKETAPDEYYWSYCEGYNSGKQRQSKEPTIQD